MESNEQKKSDEQNRNRGVDTRNRLASVRGEGEGDRMKEGEEISQRTCMYNPQTQKTVWGWPGEGGEGTGRWGLGVRGDMDGDIGNTVDN